MIYTRVSADRTGVARSVAEQESECRAVCERNGWPVAEVLTDNDRGASRWSKGHRPGYDKLASILEPGDVLVTWEASRAQRDLSAYNALRQLCTEKDVLWCYSGRVFDLSRSDDRFMTLLDIGLAEKEVDQTRERVMRTLNANLAAGKPHGVRAFGYTIVRDPNTGRSVGRDLHPTEAPVVREVVDRFLGGESLRSIAMDLNERGVKTTHGRKWRGPNLGVAIAKPTYAGLRAYKGQVTGKGTWPAIITEDEHLRIKAILADPARRVTTRGSKPRYLISGIATCGVCGTRAYRIKHHGRDVYSCRRGCVTHRIEETDTQVLGYLFKLLSNPHVRERTAEHDDTATLEARGKIEAIRARMEEFAEAAADGDITPKAYATMEKKWLAEIAELEEVANRSLPHPAMGSLLGPNPQQIWERLDLETKRGIIRSVMTVQLNSVKNQPHLPPVEIAWHS